MSSDQVYADREVLVEAQQRGPFATLLAFFRLSGPGWLQSAITLGGGSLGSALYLGVLGGTSMLWLQLIAIIVGVIMLSAISYVALSTGKRPYRAINEHINPVLGVGWIGATIMANMIWCMAQFSLCYDVLDTIVLADSSLLKVGEGLTIKQAEYAQYRLQGIVTALILFAATIMVLLNMKPGWASKIFDLLLKLIIGVVVVCFVAAVVKLATSNEVNWGEVFSGFIPNLGQWFKPPPSVASLIETLGTDQQTFWKNRIVTKQQEVMISTTATAVGINMTFLLPYSMLKRGWDKPFRGLARFDLLTGMAIPYLLVTSCIVIAAAHSFHVKADEDFLSDDPAKVVASPLFKAAAGNLEARFVDTDKNVFAKIDEMPSENNEQIDAKAAAKQDRMAQLVSEMSQEERQVAVTLVKPNARQLAASLAPLLGPKRANLVFGIGAFCMGFSTIIILMLINGYAVSEALGQYNNGLVHFLGCLAAGLAGALWPIAWDGESKTWLIIMASTFGAILLPIAYVAFFALMNSESLLKHNMPRGGKRVVWNVLMLFGVVAAFAQAISALYTKVYNPETELIELGSPTTLVIGAVIAFVAMSFFGFSARPREDEDDEYREDEMPY